DNLADAARRLALQIRSVRASTGIELDAAFAGLSQTDVDGLMVATDPFFFDWKDQIIASAARLSLPTLYIRREFADAGGLMSYGSNSDETYGWVGDYAGRILAGARPGDLPVQQPIKLEFVINLKTAKSLGLEVSPQLLARADEVIE